MLSWRRQSWLMILPLLWLGAVSAAPVAAASPIVIYVEEGAGPYSRSEQGKPAGLSFELVEAIFAEAGIAVDYRLVPYARCMAETKAGRGAGCFLTAKNHEVLDDYAWHARPEGNRCERRWP